MDSLEDGPLALAMDHEELTDRLNRMVGTAHPSEVIAANGSRNGARKPPTRLKGYVEDAAFDSLLADLLEQVRDVAWPQSVQTYQQMRHDAKLTSIVDGYSLQIERATWQLDGTGCRPEVVSLVADDMDLPVKGADRPGAARTRGVSWPEHLRGALTMLVFGHAGFELEADVSSGQARLVGLWDRPQHTIDQIHVDPKTGRFTGISQELALGPFDTPEIKADRLAWYAHRREGAQWFGRALPLDTPIATPDGWTTMGELQEGSRLFDERGRICHVVAVSRVWKSRPCYRVSFSDGTSLVADENHLWESHTFKARHHGHAPTVLTTAEMAQTMYYGTGKRPHLNHAVVKPQPLQYVKQHLPIDPYVLGAWLGDGSKHNGTITQAVWDAQDLANLIEERGYPTKIVHNSPPGTNGRLVKVYGDFQRDLRTLDVILNKHIPEAYLRGSIQQRLDLLSGLMDSDGSSQNGACEFVNTNKNLVDGVAELARSLGCRVSVYERKIKDQSGTLMPSGGTTRSFLPAWRVYFSPNFTPFKLPRKVDRFETGDRRQRGKMPGKILGPRKWKTVTAIEPVDPQDTVCIQVDSPSHLFLAGEQLVPTHNSLLRPGFAPWLFKREMMRVLATSSRRFGMGVPVARWPESANPTPQQISKAQEMASAARVGDTSGAAMPPGAWLELVGLSGGVPDTLAFVKWLDQQMSLSVLMQHLDLGQTQTGSRALGESFIDSWLLALETIGSEVADVATRQVAARIVGWNWGLDEPVPKVTVSGIGSRREVTAESLKVLLDSGALDADPALKEWVRREFRLPEPDPPQPAPTRVQAPDRGQNGNGQREQREPVAAATSPSPTTTPDPGPTRYEQPELPITAQAEDEPQDEQDDDEMRQVDQDHAAALAALLAAWPLVAAPLVPPLAQAATEAATAGTVATVATLALPGDAVAGIGQRIGQELRSLADQSARRAHTALAAQGVQLELPDVDTARLDALAAATAELLTGGYRSSAARAAMGATSPDVDPDQAGQAVREATEELTRTATSRRRGQSRGFVATELAAALQAAVHVGRAAVFRGLQALGVPVTWVADETNDRNTCGPCREVNGREFDTLPEALAAYPVGVFVGCLGRNRCRGQLRARIRRGAEVSGG